MIVEVKINQRMDVEVDIQDIIGELNNLPIIQRWNAIAQILNGFTVLDISELMPDQKAIVEKYLLAKIELFKTI